MAETKTLVHPKSEKRRVVVATAPVPPGWVVEGEAPADPPEVSDSKKAKPEPKSKAKARRSSSTGQENAGNGDEEGDQ